MNFLTQKMVVEADDSRFDEIMAQVVQVCRKVDGDCTIQL